MLRLPAIVIALLFISPTRAADFASSPTADQIEFFEKRIRPVLAENCYECHSASAKKVKGDLLLDTRAGVIKGGSSGAVIVPGDPNVSSLIKAVRRTDPDSAMPPKKSLQPEEIADLEKWVVMGAPDPRTGDAPKSNTLDLAKAREWWSFKPIANPKPPKVKLIRWPHNDIDRFILARIEKAGLKPAADADRRALIRRTTFDLIGLPPTPAEVEDFLNDKSPIAFEKVIDRLLSSPAYGERWGRHWLDVVRYADTAGDNSDFPIPQMYRYRNWVINAINRDLPYDEFVRQQLAGDLLPAANEKEKHEKIIATGYIANARRFGSRVNDYPQHLTIEDTIDNLGRAFLGLTVSCARCHDHKFDPISTADYYGLYGIFHSTRYPWPGIELEQKQRDLVPLVPENVVAQAKKAHKEKQSKLDAEIKRLEGEVKNARDDAKKKLEKELADAKKALEKHNNTPLPFEQAYAVADSPKIEDVTIQIKGDPEKKGPMVPRRFPMVMGGPEVPRDIKSSGRRQLADWIVAPENPLAARVMANRIWHYHFGRGLVPTPNDFGKQGKPPTHPELLDYLATRFIDSGWSIKSMHRLIMLSRAYQLSSARSDDAIARDANNELLASFPRRRLDAESIRDSILTLGGSIDLRAAGPHPFPPQTEWKFTQHNPFKATYETRHRSIYLMTQRIQRDPYLAIFDGADPSASTAFRTTSTTPLQALYLLNDKFVHEQSRGFAKRLLEIKSDPARIERAYQLAFARPPAADEAKNSAEFINAIRAKLESKNKKDAELETWQSFARALFRLNEFIYID